MRPRQTLFVFLTVGLLLSAAALFLSDTLRPNPLVGSGAESLANRPLGAALTLNPATAVPNQPILLSGTGFTSATSAGGSGAEGVHQIKGEGFSFITLHAAA